MYQEEYHEEEIDLRELFQIIFKHIKIIITVPVIFALIGALISIYMIKPVYESSTTLMVISNKGLEEKINLTDVNLSKGLIYTYAEMAKSNTVMEKTKNSLKLHSINPNSITISPVKDTQILKVSVQNTEPALAADIANTLVEEFTTEVIRITKEDNVSVVDYATIPQNPIKPKILMNTAISGILGGMLILGAVFLIEYLDKTIKAEKDIEKYIGISVIGTIPNFDDGRKQSNGKIHNNRRHKLTGSRILQEDSNKY